MTVSGGMPTALDMAVLYGAAAGLASSSRSPARLVPVEARGAGLAWSKTLPRVPGRARCRAGVLPSPLELRQTTALVGRFGSGKRPGRGGRLEGVSVGVVEGQSGPRRAPILALRGSPRTQLFYRDRSR